MQSSQFSFPVQAICAIGEPGTALTWAVPAGFDFLLTDFAATSPDETTVNVRIIAPVLASIFQTTIGTGSPVQSSSHWKGGVLVPSGSTIDSNTTVSAASLIVSGYLLTPTSATLSAAA